jgi:hypothetical protein
MTLEEFIENHNVEGAVVLLVGKREVKAEDQNKLRSLGKLLAERMDKVQFRSGNAKGADELFAQGVALIDPSRMHVVIPDSGHRKKARKGLESYSLDDMSLVQEDRAVYESKKHSTMENLVDRYVAGKRDRATPMITPIIRDAVKVVGHNQLAPSRVGIFYIDILDPESGGTGFTRNACLRNNVPVFDQRCWFEWLK